jgi:hypothetical protein
MTCGEDIADLITRLQLEWLCGIDLNTYTSCSHQPLIHMLYFQVEDT